MRKHLVFIAFALSTSFLQAQIVDIPDTNFKMRLVSYVPKIDLNGNGEIEKLEAESVLYLDVSNSQIKDLTGIEFFTNLRELRCNNNLLANLDLSKNTGLGHLNCTYNVLSSLDISNSEFLIELFCLNNKLTSLDVSKNLKLENLNCNNNILSSLDVSANPNLEILNCESNPFEKLDLSNNLALNILNCSYSNLNQLDITKNENLEFLTCRSTNIKVLDLGGKLFKSISFTSNVWNAVVCSDFSFESTSKISKTCHSPIIFPDSNFKVALINNGIDKNKNGEIEEIEAYEIKGIFVSKSSIANLSGIEYFPSLTYLDCSENSLTELDLTKCEILDTLICSTNKLNKLKTNYVPPSYLDCSWNQLDDETVLGAKYLNCSHNKFIYPKIGAYKHLDCSNNMIKFLDFSYVFLETLICSGNEIKTLDLRNYESLDTLICDRNKLDELNLGLNTNLTYLKCDSNKIKKFSFYSEMSLTSLDCKSNQITSFGSLLRLCKNLKSFQCDNNDLNELDISTNYKMEDISVKDNSDLLKICINQAQLIKSSNWRKDSLTIFDTGCAFDTQAVYIPDRTLRNNLLGFDSNFDGILQKGEAKTITSLTIHGNFIKDMDGYSIDYSSSSIIFDLTGIEELTNLDTLDISQNEIRTLDLTKNKRLTYLNCGSNLLLDIDLSENVNLKWLDCSSNGITSIVLSNDSLKQVAGFALRQQENNQNSTIAYLDCHSNQLSSLDLRDYTSLTYLDATSNPDLASICVNSDQITKTETWNKDTSTDWSLSCVTVTTGIYDEPITINKVLLRIVNTLGQEIKPEQAINGVYIYQYTDGSINKIAK